MLCPYCGSAETKVVDKREAQNAATRRRRECLKCTKRFTTYERVEDFDLIIVKKDGRRESFERNKLMAGVKRACEKCPVSQEKIEKTVDDIESELRRMDSIEIPSTKVGEIVMRKLKSLSKVAYIRFASVYRSFEDIETFEKELKKLKR